MSKIAVMGDYDSVYGFGALGLIEKNLIPTDPEERAKYEDRITPAIILIPGVSGNTGEGVQRVKGSVEQAVGSDILFGDMK